MRDRTVARVTRLIPASVVCVCALLCLPRAIEGQVQLTDQNSSVGIVTNSQAGMNSWLIDGYSVLDQQWFWYRVGPSGPQASLNTLPATYSSSGPSQVIATFTGATFIVTLNLQLTGSTPGSGNADMSEVFSIKNTSANTIFFHFFEYSNFVLGGGLDTVSIPNSNMVSQIGDLGSVTENANVTGLPGFPSPMHHEANVFSNTLAALNSGLYTLDDASSAGPGDVTWAFEWDTVNGLGAGNSVNISKNINVLIPEPGAFSLAAAGLAGLWLLRYRRSK